MTKNKQRMLLGASLTVGLMASSMALAQATAPPPAGYSNGVYPNGVSPSGAQQPREMSGGMPGRPGQPGMMPMRHEQPVFVRAIETVGLSDSQKMQIREIMRSSHEQMKQSHMTLKNDRDQFEVTSPDAPGYKTLAKKLGDEEAQMAITHTAAEANDRARVVSLLNPDQKARFLSALNKFGSDEMQSHSGPEEYMGNARPFPPEGS